MVQLKHKHESRNNTYQLSQQFSSLGPQSPPAAFLFLLHTIDWLIISAALLEGWN